MEIHISNLDGPELLFVFSRSFIQDSIVPTDMPSHNSVRSEPLRSKHYDLCFLAPLYIYIGWTSRLVSTFKMAAET